ncbi:hypothetical protein CPB86DRAFT_738277 [Serendipita vermifera]|nr:hypothetical protein CPB86DRAFT_738277 [Serendipita vermifera]
MSPPVITKPILLHSMRMNMCDPAKLTQAECNWKSQWYRNWYAADWAYALSIVYFFCATIIVFSLVRWILFQRNRVRNAHTATALPGYKKLTATARYIANIQYKVGSWYSPQLGSIILIAIFALFAALLTLVPQPYYWPKQAFGGSPPIATRTGWLALGMLPFLLALGAKWNLITHLTGTSHEKLQVFHRWTAWIMYILSLIHTFPFIINNIKQGTMMASFRTKPWYWTGIACLVPQTWLVFMSFGPIRNAYYEFFKIMHFISATLFVVFLFIHCNFRLSSWDYFIATVVVYGISFLARTYKAFIVNGFGLRAEFTTLPGDLLRVNIPIPPSKSSIRWKPGQHFFIRFLKGGVHQLTNHPFTIASLDKSTYHTDELASKTNGNGQDGVERREIVCYIRVKSGMTGRMASVCQSAQNTSGTSVLLDGPYGGMEGSLRVYERVLLLAGGSGGSFILPVLEDLVLGLKSGQTCSKIHVVWATKTHDSVEWFEAAVRSIIELAPANAVTVTIHVTDGMIDDSGGDLRTEPEQSSDDGKEKVSSPTSATVTTSGMVITSGRPHLPAVIEEYVKQPGTVGIAACGPDSLKFDVHNAVAHAELGILRRDPSVGAKEVYLHVESFGW